MSETVGYKGKLTPVYCDDEMTLEELCEDVCERNMIELPKYYDNYTEFFQDEEGGHVIINGSLYKIEKETFDYENLYQASKNQDGSIDFLVAFHNGGCGLSEALTDALGNID